MANVPTTDSREARQDDLMPIGTVVAELQHLYPDLTLSSLRFLEREGMIAPHRSRGGHRLYSRADVQRIRQIKEWQSRRLSLAEIRSLLQQQSHTHSTIELRGLVLDHLLQGRLREAQAAVLAADDARQLDLAGIFDEVLTPILVDIGTRWETGEVQVSQEKEISEAIREVVVELSMRHRAANARGPAIVAATVQGELHELGLRMVCGVLGAAGYRVTFLGANAAPEHIAEAVDRHRPAAVLLSAGSSDHFAAVGTTMAAIRALPITPAPWLLVGGAAVPYAVDEIAAMGAIPMTTGDYSRLPDEIGSLIARQ